MQRTIERIEGDTAGIAYEIPVFRFAGTDSTAPSTYIQAALHAGELPGVVAIDALMPALRKADAEGRIRGRITVVPAANPVGRAQYLFGENEGRFHLGSRTNFNRDFPLLDRPDPALLPAAGPVDMRLKHRLLGLSLGHDIVLDLHCDDEGVAYLYVPDALWPAMRDCASAMGVEAVITWGGSSGSSFDEASLHPRLKASTDPARTVVTTVEYRGLRDVDRTLAEKDAAGIYRLLAARGVIADAALPPPAPFGGLVAPIDHIEMVATPVAGAVLFDVRPGQRVAAGERLATIVHAPGEENGRTDILAPQAGFVLTHRYARVVRAGSDIVKLVGDAPSRAPRSGALEA